MKSFFIYSIIALAFTLTPMAAQAQKSLNLPDSQIMDIPAPQPSSTNDFQNDVEETHPMLRLTPDKSELVRLDEDAVSVVVGNPAHLGVLLDTPRVLVLIPRAPGATYFTVLNRDGNPIMQRHAIIAPPKQKYVRIRRSCASVEGGCNATSVYFCPDICHEVAVTQLNGDDEEGGNDMPMETPDGPAMPAMPGEGAPQ